MPFVTAETIGEFIKDLIVFYLVLTFIFTIYSVIRMYVIEHKANDVKSGRKRVLELRKSGRYLQIPIYSMEEMGKNKNKEDVRLYVFPNDTGVKTKFVLILPGGGYAHTCTREEGYPIAAKLNEMGYTCFILEYRTRFKCTKYAPMEDVANALKYIEKNQDSFNVTMEDYALMGFSAGGNLAAMFGTHHHGYEEFGVQKPKAIILGYPWTSINHWLRHPYWNIWIGLLGVWLSIRGEFYMFGPNPVKMHKHKKGLDVQLYIDEDFPKTYMFSGGWDVLVPASRHADILEKAFKDKGVEYKYQKYFGVPHGIGLGKNTAAEGWLGEAIEYWEQ